LAGIDQFSFDCVASRARYVFTADLLRPMAARLQLQGQRHKEMKIAERSPGCENDSFAPV
jgi:hypothetical protein